MLVLRPRIAVGIGLVLLSVALGVGINAALSGPAGTAQRIPSGPGPAHPTTSRPRRTTTTATTTTSSTTTIPLVTAPTVPPVSSVGTSAPVPAASVTVYASSVRADRPLSGITYDPRNVLDGDNRTAWVSDGTTNIPPEGQWIQLNLAHPYDVGQVVIADGYDKSPEIYGDRARVAGVTVQSDTGQSLVATLADTPAPQTLDLNWTGVTWVRLTVDSTYPGLQYLDVAINEVGLIVSP